MVAPGGLSPLGPTQRCQQVPGTARLCGAQPSCCPPERHRPREKAFGADGKKQAEGFWRREAFTSLNNAQEGKGVKFRTGTDPKGSLSPAASAARSEALSGHPGSLRTAGPAGSSFISQLSSFALAAATARLHLGGSTSSGRRHSPAQRTARRCPAPSELPPSPSGSPGPKGNRGHVVPLPEARSPGAAAPLTSAPPRTAHRARASAGGTARRREQRRHCPPGVRGKS